MIIRQERAADVEAIFDLTKLAFEHYPYGDHTEQFVINALRVANALTVSLVAEVDGKIVGHVAFSPVSISDGSSDWYGLGPVSVLPEYQNQGIGSTIIREGLMRLRSLGAKGCVLLGNPTYYRRFGFVNQPALMLEEADQQHFLVLPLKGTDRSAQGVVSFHEAFSATA